jgi:hypothetical protein
MVTTLKGLNLTMLIGGSSTPYQGLPNLFTVPRVSLGAIQIQPFQGYIPDMINLKDY